MTTSLTSWSFSRYNTYSQCPALAKYKFIDKLKEPSAPAMERGDMVHKAAEAFIDGKRPDIIPELEGFGEELKGLAESSASGHVETEQPWAFKRNWSRTTWNDWIGCFLRIKADVVRASVPFAKIHTPEATTKIAEEPYIDVIDWKTGRYRDESHAEYIMQLELYALGALKMYPQVQVVNTMLAYTDQSFVFATPPYTRADEPRLRGVWEARIRPMMADRTFEPNPGNACRWCNFRASKGGPCKY